MRTFGIAMLAACCVTCILTSAICFTQAWIAHSTDWLLIAIAGAIGAVVLYLLLERATRL